ncbi:hypothetical protein FRC03_009794 [Tulasnella sp. 419]|nr:hypothetical protein FRC03_009794 [Tulasnella sp. 419]
MTSDIDIPATLHRQFFERLACSPRRITRLWLQLSPENVRLGVLQEITKNLKDLELLCIRGVVTRAYFTYFLQDITGCLSRCKKLKVLAFAPPKGSIPAQGPTHYVETPNSDPSVPLPPLTSSNQSHPYPSSGPDLFRREQYIANLYGSTNVSLRNVRMPSGTQWKPSSHDDDEEPSLHSEIFDFHHDLCSQPLSPRLHHRRITVPTVGPRDAPSQIPSSLSPPQVIVLSAPASVPSVQYRTPCWGWEPDRSCVDARRWWEECGLKPPSPISSFDDSTEVESDDEDVDMSSEAGTDVEEAVKGRPGKSEESEPCQRLVSSQPKVQCCNEVSRSLRVPSQKEVRSCPQRISPIIRRKTSEEEVEILL